MYTIKQEGFEAKAYYPNGKEMDLQDLFRLISITSKDVLCGLVEYIQDGKHHPIKDTLVGSAYPTKGTRPLIWFDYKNGDCVNQQQKFGGLLGGYAYPTDDKYCPRCRYCNPPTAKLCEMCLEPLEDVY